jgi:pimeloyl-ACP methyl ester carboxylesterase
MRTRAAVLCGAAVALAGSLTAVPAEASAPHSAKTFRAVKPSWKKCGTTDYPMLQCASLKVPLDHANPHGRQITLALSRVPHTAAKFQGPLLVNPGGPGGDGLRLAGFVATSLPKEVAAQYDIIGFDPRGVGASKPALDCKPGHFGPVRPDSVPATPEAERANLARGKSFAAACTKKYGHLLPHINTVSAAHDIDAIRQALGARKINYLGYSYGTYLGSVYAKLYPQRVRRLVLDSIADPTDVWYAANLNQDHAFNDRHRAFMAWVAKYDARYRLGTDPEKIEAAWYAMRAALARNPAGGKVGASELEDTFVPGSYYNGYWPYLAEAFAAYVNHKNTGPLVEVYKHFGAVDAADDNSYSIYTSVQCRDAFWPRDWHQWRKDNWAAYEKAPFMTWNNAWYNAPCAFWPTDSAQPMSIAGTAVPGDERRGHSVRGRRHRPRAARALQPGGRAGRRQPRHHAERERLPGQVPGDLPVRRHRASRRRHAGCGVRRPAGPQAADVEGGVDVRPRLDPAPPARLPRLSARVHSRQPR